MPEMSDSLPAWYPLDEDQELARLQALWDMREQKTKKIPLSVAFLGPDDSWEDANKRTQVWEALGSDWACAIYCPVEQCKRHSEESGEPVGDLRHGVRTRVVDSDVFLILAHEPALLQTAQVALLDPLVAQKSSVLVPNEWLSRNLPTMSALQRTTAEFIYFEREELVSCSVVGRLVEAVKIRKQEIQLSVELDVQLLSSSQLSSAYARVHSQVLGGRMDPATLTAILGAATAAIGLFDRIADQVERFLTKREEPAVPPQHRLRFEKQGDAMVAVSDGNVIQTISAKDLGTLPENQLRHVKVLEESMENHYAVWCAVYPTLALEVDPIREAKIRRQLEAVIGEMKKDLEDLLGFLEACGFALDDHYQHIREVIRSAGTSQT